MKQLKELGYLQWLKEECNIMNVKPLPGGRWAGIHRFMFTHAILVGKMGDMIGHDDRWCYSDYSSAYHALEKWDGSGEPEGWHRHPISGRRREKGDPTTEYVAP